MSGMLRLKDEAALQELLKNGNLREAQMITGKKSGKQIQPNETLRSEALQIKAEAERREKKGSDIEELFAQQIRLVGNLPMPIREYHHLRGSKHRLDFAWPEYRVNGMQLGAEVQGMVHRVKHNFSSDLEKRARGILQGWLVLEVGGEQIRSGKAMEWLQELFKRAKRDSE